VAWDFEAAAGIYRLPAGLVCDYGVRTYSRKLDEHGRIP